MECYTDNKYMRIWSAKEGTRTKGKNLLWLDRVAISQLERHILWEDGKQQHKAEVWAKMHSWEVVTEHKEGLK